MSYEAAGYWLHTLIVCTVPLHERGEIALRARNVDDVVAIREVVTSNESVHIDVVGIDRSDLGRIGCDLKIVDEDNTRDEYTRPFHQFGTEAVVDNS